MLVKVSPDVWTKLSVLGVHARYDVCSLWSDDELNACFPGIYYASTGRGRVPILKVLFTNICYRNCRYCANRKDRDRVRRLSFEVDELVKITLTLYRRGLIKGIFLSSGTGEWAAETFVRMGEVAKRLRERGFEGYVHLKVLPGVSLDTVDFYRRFADRISYNLEAPDNDSLKVLAEDKSLTYGLKVLSTFGGTTQFVVDYGRDSDSSYLLLMERLFKIGVKRVYFKAFVPVIDTPMESVPAGRRLREKRLYEASFLLQKYGFSAKELLFEGRLPLDRDVKSAWAQRHPEFFPVDVASASYGELLRVPGIGPKTAKKIVELRKRGELDQEGLKKLLPSIRRSSAYILFRGRRICRDGDTCPVLPLFSEAGVERV